MTCSISTCADHPTAQSKVSQWDPANMTRLSRSISCDGGGRGGGNRSGSSINQGNLKVGEVK